MGNMNPCAFISLTLLISQFTFGTAKAQAIVREEVRLSKLALTAFECSLLAPDERETNRLLEIGVTSGRSFVGGISSLTKMERNHLSGQLDPIWRQVWNGTSQSVVAKAPNESLGQNLWGPSTDFILGRILSDRSAFVNKTISTSSTNQITNSPTKATLFRERQCSVLHYRTEHSFAPSYYRSWHN
jgi:hypothetical protein